MNDIECALTYTKCLLFADDTTVYHSGRNIDQVKTEIENDLNVLIDWFKANKLSLNITKTDFIHFKKTKNGKSINLNFGGIVLKPSKKLNSLAFGLKRG